MSSSPLLHCSNCSAQKKVKSQILVSGDFGACVNMLMFQCSCLAVIPNSISSAFIWHLPHPVEVQCFEFKYGHFCLIAGTTRSMSICQYTILVTPIGIVLIVPLGLFILSLCAAFLSMNGHIPILPSDVHSPSSLYCRRANAAKQERYLHHITHFLRDTKWSRFSWCKVNSHLLLC